MKSGETLVATSVQPPRLVSMSQKAWNESSVGKTTTGCKADTT